MQMRHRAPAALVVLVALVSAGCSTDGSASAPAAPRPNTVADTIEVPAPAAPVPTAPAAGPPDTAGAATAAPPTTVTPSTTVVTPSTTTVEPTTVAPTTSLDREHVETRTLGESVQGRPIVAERRGTPGGRVVLVIGVIHGNENDGLAIMDRLHELDVPAGVDLWLVDSMNPDGVANDTRQNAHRVDLNRNFPENWGPIGVPGDGEYAGPSAASEPETQAMVDFISEIRPDVTLWYHQDLYRIAPGRGRDGRIRDRYSQLTGIPIVNITGGTYTGVAATWARHLLDPGVAFIVELGDSVTDAEADLHADAVLTIAGEDI